MASRSPVSTKKPKPHTLHQCRAVGQMTSLKELGKPIAFASFIEIEALKLQGFSHFNAGVLSECFDRGRGEGFAFLFLSANDARKAIATGKIETKTSIIAKLPGYMLASRIPNPSWSQLRFSMLNWIKEPVRIPIHTRNLAVFYPSFPRDTVFIQITANSFQFRPAHHA